jgi:hypothetical protein
MTRLMLRFTLRDLFWLIVVAALAVSWFSEHHRSVHAQAAAAEREAALSKDVRFAERFLTTLGFKGVWDKRNDPLPRTPPPLPASAAATMPLLAYPPKPNEM